MKTKKLLLGLSAVSFFNLINASNVDLSNTKTGIDKQTRLKSVLRKLLKKQAIDANQPKPPKEKFSFSLGASRSGLKVKASPDLAGESVAKYAVFGYEFSKEWSGDVSYINNDSSLKSKDRSIKIKSGGDIFAASLDYKILKWLVCDFTYTTNKGNSKTTNTKATNITALSKNYSGDYKLTLKATIPLPNNLLILPSVGIGRALTHTREFVDNNRTTQPKKTIKRNELFLDTKVAYPINAYFIPYISLGYANVLDVNQPLKSHSTYKGGAGAILLGGAINIDWNMAKINSSTTSNSLSMTGTAKF